MELHVTIKQAGKKHALLIEQSLEIDYNEVEITLEKLLMQIVHQQLAEYQRKMIVPEDTDVTHTPQHNYLAVLTDTGKAGFGNLYNENKISLAAAQQNVLQAFEDGIFVVFQGDQRLEFLSDSINLALNKSFTFIRLTFLTGSYW